MIRPSAARQGRPAAAPYWRAAKRADARARRLRSKKKAVNKESLHPLKLNVAL
ncbi:hypothetical protein [Parasphingorhabdus sp.]|uniref:hypothetical protein n=1 Tax=Parasphingorhabdus sp. TaxID=2709688 RepID=UPI0032980FFE